MRLYKVIRLTKIRTIMDTRSLIEILGVSPVESIVSKVTKSPINEAIGKNHETFVTTLKINEEVKDEEGFVTLMKKTLYISMLNEKKVGDKMLVKPENWSYFEKGSDNFNEEGKEIMIKWLTRMFCK